MATKGFTISELRARRLFPITENGNPDNIALFVDINIDEWEGDPKDLLRALVKKKQHGEDLSGLPVYKRCASTYRLKKDECYFQINEFDLEETSKSTRLASSINESKRQLRRETNASFHAKNLAVLRKYMMGDTEALIHCPIDGTQLDMVEFWGELLERNWQQHHFLVRNGSSVHKESANPGEILKSVDFTSPSTKARKGIEDMMNTVFLSPSSHERVHRAKRDSDITFYSQDQLPWALRSETNYREWCEFVAAFGYAEPFPSYQQWIDSLKLENN